MSTESSGLRALLPLFSDATAGTWKHRKKFTDNSETSEQPIQAQELG